MDDFINEIQAFGIHIRLLRKSQGIRQKDLAKALHIGVHTLSKLERGQVPKRLKVDVILKLIFLFDQNLYELYLSMDDSIN